MLYFPSSEHEGRKDLGTRFYRPKNRLEYSNFNNELVKEEELLKVYNVDVNTVYQSCHLQGFEKTDVSWHSTNMESLEGEVRRSVNIRLISKHQQAIFQDSSCYERPIWES